MQLYASYVVETAGDLHHMYVSALPKMQGDARNECPGGDMFDCIHVGAAATEVSSWLSGHYAQA
jgi:protein-L-isoaspartate O-methyltransferase